MLVELRTFVAVVRHGTFAAAGDHMGLTQSAVSGQMKRLETKLGAPLFARTGRAAVLNETGRRVLARAGDILTLADTLADPVDAAAQTGELRIGAIASAHSSLLCTVLPAFKNEFRKMQVQVMPGISLELLDRLDAGDLDLAIIIRPGFGLPKTLMWHPLMQERFVLAAPLHWPIEDPHEALSSRPFLRYSRSSFGGRLVQRYLEENQVQVQSWAELDDIPTLLTMVADGHGIAIVPEAEAYAAAFQHVQIIALDDPGFVRDIGILSPISGSAAAVRFAEICRERTG